MADGTRGVPGSEPEVCPHCGTRGWPSTMRVAEWTAVCGSRWLDADVVSLGAACPVIEHKNDLLDERDQRINELLLELAKHRGVLTVLPGGAA